jgi:hypothetical protein
MSNETKPNYTRLGYIPELGHYLLRDNRNGTLELWRPVKYAMAGTIIKLEGHELEFVREVRCAYRVGDNDYNRANAMDDIGRIYIDRAPANVLAHELR